MLIVDDDKVDQELVLRALRKSHLDVSIDTAKTVDEGLDLYQEHSYDIILLDYRMPERDGTEMIYELTQLPTSSNTAIVMMSSSEDEQLAIDCLKAGAHDFLMKSEVTGVRLRRAVLQAKARFELEQQLAESYKKVKILAESDPLTGLSNRAYFEHSLRINIVNNIRDKHKIALLLIDLNNLKFINDTYGHDVSDRLLLLVVDSIKSCLRGNELFARLGGDEFSICLSNLDTAEDASKVATRVVETLTKPFLINESEIHSTASVGISIYPDNATDFEELFKQADIAMYRAKKLGRSRVCFFEEEMQEQFYLRALLEKELKQAQELRQFLLHYQPILNPKNKTLFGFEALIRWGVDGRLRSPRDFVPVAEQTQQMVSIGRWIIKTAISSLGKFNQGRENLLVMTINLSTIQFHDVKLVDYIQKCLIEYKVAPSLVAFELTESAFSEKSHHSINIIRELDKLGCKIALDNFGKGSSSVNHLKKYPISLIKLDRSLMPKNLNDSQNMALIKGLTVMLQLLKREVVAEGVETEAHIAVCSELGINLMQGFYFSEAKGYEEIVQDYLQLDD
ncbi:GGDEF domain-containing response regulator [Marinomonas sp. S3726]|uniref:two-component system response regulator n=1 Tax=Marinomonas sp. S3726 TaxID=579484 RepID=UPI001EE2D90F|nr:GGDEF domain-containing response regulator [Marinomonas sp. S3726]